VNYIATGGTLVFTASTDEWASPLLVFDDNGDEHNDMLSSWAFLFEDGSWVYSHNGFVEIAASDPTPITMVVDTCSGQVLSAEYVVQYLVGVMVTSSYEELGDMVPVVEGDFAVTFYDGVDPPFAPHNFRPRGV
jgi:hypothetical protein